MEITGRVTADAKVFALADERQVVNFTIAINDYYKPRGSSEGKQITTYINCSYWLSIKIAERLVKGTLVQVYGRIGVQAYNDMDGNARASLTFHGNNIKILASSKGNNQQEQSGYASAAISYMIHAATDSTDNAPF
jgi:single-strand DNA-binding protein